jgi:hypothetical protein
MWWWWFFMCTWLCINILVYKQQCKKCQNELLWITKHVFWHNYFLNMWIILKAKSLKLSEYKQLAKWFKRKSFHLQPFPFKFQDFEIFIYDLVFIKFTQQTHICIEGNILLLDKRFQINYMILCIPLIIIF